jgi:predicted permease
VLNLNLAFPVISDLRHAFRHLVRAPGLTVVAIVTLALGIGLNTSMFSVMNVLLLRPLPYQEGERLVRVFASTPQARNLGFTERASRDLQEARPDFGRLTRFAWWGANLTEPGRPAELLVSLRTEADFADVLGVKPMLGRWFTAAEDHPDSPVVLISEMLWRRWFDRDPAVLGRTIHVDGHAATVIGVMPDAVAAPIVFGVIDVWRPLGLTPEELVNPEGWIHMVGRLGEGVSLAQANTALGAVAARLAADQPADYANVGLRAEPLHASGTDDTARWITWLTLGLSAFVLLIACANLANLQLARISGRTRELAIRAALGAPRVRLLRPMLLESVMLAVAGGALGLVVAWGCNAWIGRHVVFNNAAPGHELPLDLRVLAFAGAVSLATGVLFGSVPGWLGTRVPVNDALKEQGRGSTVGPAQQRFRRMLVIGEFALALVLLAGAGLMLAGMHRMLGRDPGWRPDRLAVGYVATQTPKYQDLSEALDFYERMQDRLAELPGVEAVGFGWEVPVWDYRAPRPFEIEGRSAGGREQGPSGFLNATLPGYFDALQIGLIDGRDFTRRDRVGSPAVAIINETMASTLWPGERALGKRIRNTDAAEPVWMEIVGVVRDVRFPGNLAEPATRFQIYKPFAQEPWRWGALVLRTSAPPATLVEPMRRAVAAIDPDIPVWEPRTIDQEIVRRTANSKLIGELLGGVALLGLFLAALGIYGVVSHTVAQRTSEIGVRMALGADLSAVYRLILGSGLRLAVWGTGIGLAGALLVGQALAAVSPEITAQDWPLLGAITTVLLLTALVACWLPARRAARVNPVVALRGE